MEDAPHKGEGSPRPPNCLRCRYFKVTWDPAFPRSCGVFGIKSRELPAALVFRSTGQRCPAFLVKDGVK
jgi:hypothetical protein